MSRIREISSTTPADVDADVRALMEDIDASLADFEKRLEAEQRGAAAPLSIVDRAAALPDRKELPPVEAAPAAETDLQVSGFLAELENEAAVRQGSGLSEAEAREARNRRLHDALTRIFQFFNLFCRHANVLAPDIKRSYRLDAHIAYSDLAWQEASVRYRLQNLREKALMDYVALTVRLAAPAPVPVSRRWDQIEQFKKEMHILDLKAAEGMDFDEKPQQENIEIVLAPEFPIQLTFRANYNKGRVDLLSRNLDDFGIAAFVCEPADVTQQLLDELGRYLLDRTDKLPPGLQPVHLRAQL